MKEYNKLRLEWDCRRGMLELDKIIMPFYQQHFERLNAAQQETFVRLLACSDLQLFSWFFNGAEAPDAALRQMVAYIQNSLQN
ncbi:antitoxin CptB [Mesocricetibacter intestinalis]|uniref:FAD assembly factor SdhE n=1 Tax=Mesocricetibacter intestinalis TaxID=1521930 RepID=A0A4R6VA95_9PAST|nr:succinate dehydrogenase assembly factor 2 [Mesocricetibacter intestinalis]TDQ56628.1 antitoxin CptB [Mesocricetibacter intestinalis]